MFLIDGNRLPRVPLAHKALSAVGVGVHVVRHLREDMSAPAHPENEALIGQRCLALAEQAYDADTFIQNLKLSGCLGSAIQRAAETELAEKQLAIE